MPFIKYSPAAAAVTPDTVQWTDQVVGLDGQAYTPFEELVVAQRVSRLNLKPTWGVTNLRDEASTGTGSTIAETGGEILLSTGTNSAGECTLDTRERGQYQAGAVGEVGVGIRIPTLPTGDSYAEWGYFDDNNGFGFGVDSTGNYVFRLTGGAQTKTYQSSWNVDTLSALDLSDGNIFQIDFTWYGYGEIEYAVNTTNSTTGVQTRNPVHRTAINGAASIVDPNQPIRIFSTNGGTSTTDFKVYVGGRQFSFIGGVSEPQKRNTPVALEAKSVTLTTYEPVLAVRKKSTLNSRTNSVKVMFSDLTIGSDQKVYWFLSYGDTLDGSWGSISNVPADSTALEVNTTATSAGSVQNRSLASGFVLASQADKNAADAEIQIPLGSSDPVALWMKKSSNNATVEVVLNFKEEW